MGQYKNSPTETEHCSSVHKRISAACTEACLMDTSSGYRSRLYRKLETESRINKLIKWMSNLFAFRSPMRQGNFRSPKGRGGVGGALRKGIGREFLDSRLFKRLNVKRTVLQQKPCANRAIVTRIMRDWFGAKWNTCNFVAVPNREQGIHYTLLLTPICVMQFHYFTKAISIHT
jgi:hypothetical protein